MTERETARATGEGTVSPNNAVPRPQQHWRQPIAIIGMSGCFPGADDLEGFWYNLAQCHQSVGAAPIGRPGSQNGLSSSGVSGNKNEAGYIENVDAFDAAFFGISEHEAQLMDPLQRLALQSAWHCVEESGYRPAELARGSTGVFAATGKSDYEELLHRHKVLPDAKLATGVASTMIANRISFCLGLTGPSLTIDTACSGSLTALHMAAQSIRSGDCAVALVSAVNIILSDTLTHSLEDEGTLSPDCRTRSFDKDANGYARGEGVACLLLKELSVAKQDGDHIHGVLIGSAINHGGRSNWLTAPNGMAQKQLIIEAWQRAGIDPRTITYIEAHGTGTALGDPVEFNAIRQAYEALTKTTDSRLPEHRCAIGSAKPNIGHLETASGLAGIEKVLLSMKHGKIPGNPLLGTPSPMCRTEGTPFHFIRETENWDQPQDQTGKTLPRRAGVSSFGFGGANGHVVLEQYVFDKDRLSKADAEILPILPISAKDKDGLRRYAQQLISFAQTQVRKAGLNPTENQPEPVCLIDFLYTFQLGRTVFPVRAAILVESWQSIADALENFITSGSDPRVLRTQSGETAPDVANDELAALSAQFAGQWASGAKIDFASLYGQRRRQRVSAPGYPFAKTRYWFTAEDTTEFRQQAATG